MKERCRDGCRTFLLIAGVVFVPAIFHTLLPPYHPYITIHFMEMIFSTCIILICAVINISSFIKFVPPRFFSVVYSSLYSWTDGPPWPVIVLKIIIIAIIIINTIIINGHMCETTGNSKMQASITKKA